MKFPSLEPVKGTNRRWVATGSWVMGSGYWGIEATATAKSFKSQKKLQFHMEMQFLKAGYVKTCR